MNALRVLKLSRVSNLTFGSSLIDSTTMHFKSILFFKIFNAASSNDQLTSELVHQYKQDREGNFVLPRLTPPLSTSPYASFSVPATVVGRGWSKILATLHNILKLEYHLKHGLIEICKFIYLLIYLMRNL